MARTELAPFSRLRRQRLRRQRPVPLSDAIPAAGTTVDPSTSGFNVVQIADADWRFDYTGECGPTGVAVRHVLTDLSGSDDDREVVDHKLACPLRPGTAYEVRVDATGGDGDRHRTELDFTSDTERAASGVTVLDGTTLSPGDVDGLFHRYVVDGVLDEIDIPIIGSLVALIVADIAERAWTELGRDRIDVRRGVQSRVLRLAQPLRRGGKP